mmetsp:Transcript_88197/g.249928  ORF Transcript_88197/g.249928 Transcript_88197/m.249928 type:complete len:223 (-) Transcript_88197:769-1437(-)
MYSSSPCPSSSPSSSSTCRLRREKSSAGTFDGFFACRCVGHWGSMPLSVDRALTVQSRDSCWVGGWAEVCGEMELMLSRPPCMDIPSGPSCSERVGSRREAWNAFVPGAGAIPGSSAAFWVPPRAQAPFGRPCGRPCGRLCGAGACWAGGGARAPASSCRALSFTTFCFQRCSRLTASSSSKWSLSTRSFRTRFARCISHACRPSSARVVGSLECNPAYDCP